MIIKIIRENQESGAGEQGAAKPSYFSRYASGGQPPPPDRSGRPPQGRAGTQYVPSAAVISETTMETNPTGATGGVQGLDIPETLGTTAASGGPTRDFRKRDSASSSIEIGDDDHKTLRQLIQEETVPEVAEEQQGPMMVRGPVIVPHEHVKPRMLSPEELTQLRMEKLKHELKIYTVACFVIIVIIIGIVIVFAVRSYDCFKGPQLPMAYRLNETTSCETDDCKQFANRFSNSYMGAVLPCEDFYEHVCGSWMQSVRVPRYRYATSTRQESQWAVDETIMQRLNSTVVSYGNQHAVQKAAALYHGCMNMAMRHAKGTKPLENLLDKYGIPRWPISHDGFQFDVMHTLAEMIRELGLSAIVSVRVGPDNHDTRKHIIYLGQPQFGVERNVLRSPYDSPYFRIRHRYKLLIFRCAQIMGAAVSNAELVVNDIVNFEGRLAAMSEEETDLPSPRKSFHLISLENLESAIPNMKWTSFLNAILREAQVTLESTDRIILTNRIYLQRLGKHLHEEQPYVVANYLAWRIVEMMAPFTVDRLRRARYRFDRYRYSMFEMTPLSRECYEHTARYMRFATAKLLYDQAQEKARERHDKAQHVADEVKDAFAVWLDLAGWMTETNKQVASIKLRDLKVNPGAPLWVRSQEDLDEYYSRIPELRREEFFAATIEVMKESVHNDLLKLRRHGYRTDFGWVESQPQADPIYQYLGNYMLLPEGFLHEPFFWLQGSPSINFGGFGSAVAYYLTLGFGSYGSMYNYKGSLDDWWSGHTRRQYESESVCFRKQVEWFTNPFTGEEINGTINQDELVASNAAIKESFKAYRVYMTKYEEFYKSVVIPGLGGYTQDQVFFISYALTMCEKIRRRAYYYDLHPKKLVPNHQRTNLALMNFDRFAIAFDCPLGSPMNPELKCDVY